MSLRSGGKAAVPELHYRLLEIALSAVYCNSETKREGEIVKKFFPFLLLNYCLIHYAAIPEVGGKITQILFRQVTGAAHEDIFFCNPLWRIIVAGWTALLQSQLDMGSLGYFIYGLELIVLNFFVVLITCFFFFGVKKWRFAVFAIYVISCFVMIPVPNQILSRHAFLQFLVR